jgi:hypothetical protein
VSSEMEPIMAPRIMAIMIMKYDASRGIFIR